jgi:hypothetical protein
MPTTYSYHDNDQIELSDIDGYIVKYYRNNDNSIIDGTIIK